MSLTKIQHYGKIFTLSDIHGELHSLIIALRDCAKIITKDIDLTKIDPDLDRYLNIDISE